MTDHDRTPPQGFDRTWNPLTEPDAPLGGYDCGCNWGPLEPKEYDNEGKHIFCDERAKALPWGKVECGKCIYGSVEVASVTLCEPEEIDCEHCSGTGSRSLRVLVEGDLFALWCRSTKHGWHSQREAMQHYKEVISGPVSFATMFLPDDVLAHLFATLAATPDVHYTIRTAHLERVEAWIAKMDHGCCPDGTPCAVCYELCEMVHRKVLEPWDGETKRCPLCETSWPLPNVIIEAVGA